MPEYRVFVARFFPLLEKLIEARRVIPHLIEVRHGGLGRLIEGIEDVKKGGVKARKLVYRVN